MSWAEFAAKEPEMAARGRQLLYRRGDGEGLLATVAGDGLPRVHPINVGVVDDRLLVFVQDRSAKARDLALDGRYALHAHQDPAEPHEFLVRGRARLVEDPTMRAAIAGDWFFTVSDAYPLYELLVEHAVFGERDSPSDWPPRYRSWRAR
ncbi:MAG: pyridoxamine 5'-phosphate oxidase family protein [Candidatus Limnocylindria bacterium]